MLAHNGCGTLLGTSRRWHGPDRESEHQRWRQTDAHMPICGQPIPSHAQERRGGGDESPEPNQKVALDTPPKQLSHSAPGQNAALGW